MSKLSWIPEDAWLGSGKNLKKMIKYTELAEGSISIEGLGETYKLSTKDNEEDSSYLLQVLGTVAVINISGSLTSTDSFFNQMFGIVSYLEIRNAVIEAVNNTDVTSILLNIDSTGGDAKGAFELADFIGKVNKTLKPIETFTGGYLASAAYLIASGTRKISASKSAIVGSIGVISVLSEVTKQLKKAGVSVQVIRTGKYKALGMPYETLTSEGKAVIQEKSDKFYNLFISAVAEGRGVQLSDVANNMAEGREFLGIDGLRAGLVDNISDVDKLVAELNVKDSPQSGSGGSTHSFLGEPNTGDVMKKALKLSAENQAKLASGVPLSSLNVEQTEAPKLSDSISAEAAASSDTTEIVKTDLKGKETVVEDPETKGAEVNPALETAASTTNDLVDYLKTTNAELTTQNAALLAETTLQKTTLESQQTVIPALETLVRLSADRLAIGLGNSAADHSGLSGLELVKSFNKLNSTFEERMPVGGIASAKADDDTQHSSNAASSTKRAAIKAAEID